MKKFMGLALVAIFAMAALASSASAKVVLTLRDSAGVIPAGTHIIATSHNLVTKTSAGNLECETDELEEVLKVNGAVKDTGTTETGMSRNFGNYLGIPGACKTSAAGPAVITTSNYPWPEELTTKNTNVTKGTKKITFTSEFLGLAPPNKCTFEDAKITSTFKAGAHGSPIPVEFTTAGAVFKLNPKIAGTAAICPKEGTLGGTWVLTDANGPVESEL